MWPGLSRLRPRAANRAPRARRNGPATRAGPTAPPRPGHEGRPYWIASDRGADNPPLMPPERKTPRLRYGRVSLPGARYFLTACPRQRAPVLAAPAEAARTLSAFETLHASGDIVLHAAVVMPDHAHALFTLGPRLTVGQALAKFKTLARDHGRVPWRWLDDGFEHRLRPHESAEDYAFYIFMNPYRARLVEPTTAWPWWRCPEPAMFRFTQHLGADGTPPAGWLATIETIAPRVVSGE